jgi:fimbrial chaperone protein
MRSGLKSKALAALLLGLVLGPARVVEASAFHVNPIRLDFTRTTTSALVTLTNESTEELRFQITAFQWAQDTAGEMKLTPTDDIVFFPSLVNLKAGEERKVRVGSATESGPVEKTYRIFFEELPALKKPEDRGAQVKIITKMGIPIFIEAQKLQLSATIGDGALKNGKLTFSLVNGGNTHYIVQSIKLAGLDAGGKTVFEKQRDGWYVLAGGQRMYDLDLPPAECAKVKTVRVEAQTDISPKPEEALIKRDLDVAQHTCGK